MGRQDQLADLRRRRDRQPVLRPDANDLNRAGISLQGDFDGNIIFGIVGLHIPPVLVAELLKNLVELRLVGENMSVRS